MNTGDENTTESKDSEGDSSEASQGDSEIKLDFEIKDESLDKLIQEEIIIKHSDDEDGGSDGGVNDDVEEESPLDPAEDEENEVQYKTLIIKSYKSSSAKENPMENINTIFQENELNIEKKLFHRQIFNDILENMKKKKLEELQTKYVEYLREAADLETFECLKCGYQTIHKANLTTHLLLIHKKKIEETWYQCLQCCYKVKKLNSLKKHQLTHVESSDDEKLDVPDIDDLNQTWNCDFCTFETYEKDSFELHQLSHKDPNDSNRYSCYVCSYKAIQKGSFQRHLVKNHQIELKGYRYSEILKCPNCEYATDLKQSFDVHLMRHKNPDEIPWLTCKYCDFKTVYRGSLRNHVRTHEQPEKKLMCEVCSKCFRNKQMLQKHSAVHKEISELSKVQKCSQCSFQTKHKSCHSQHMELHREPKFICDICGFKSRRKYNHRMHMLLHKDEKQCDIYRCAACPYYTKFKPHLKAHVKMGNHKLADWKPSDTYIKSKLGLAVKSTVCSVCGVQFPARANLRKHLRVHKSPSEIRMYKCEKCQFQTKHRTSYITHKKTHEPPELVACEVCGLKIKKRSYKKHLMTHQTASETELFTCSVCSYQTKFKAYLREHLKKRHSILTPAEKRGTKTSKMLGYKNADQQQTTSMS